MYEYKAVIKRVIDGDTVSLEINLGFHSYRIETVRLARINAPERGTPEGTAATEFVKQWEGQPVQIETIKDSQDKYGRYLAEIVVDVYGIIPHNLNDMLVDYGHAKYWDGKGARP